MKDVYAAEINRIHLFRYYNISFVVDIVSHLKPFRAYAGEKIFDAHDVVNEIIFITNGVVQLSISRGYKEVVFGFASEGGYFGDLGYYKRCLNVDFQMAKTKCSLLSLDTRVLDVALLTHADTSAKFEEEIRSRYLNYERVIASGIVRLEDGSHRTKELLLDGVAREESTILQPTKRIYELHFHRVTDHGIGIGVGAVNISSFEGVVSSDRNNMQECVCATKESMQEHIVFHPKANRKIAWDTYIGVLVIYTLLVIPIEIAFLSREEYAEMVWVGLAVDFFFLIDMLVTSRTAYYDMKTETLEVHPKAILINYLEKWFWIDLISS